MTPLRVPQPERLHGTQLVLCSLCGCSWSLGVAGHENAVADDCARASRCACHDPRFAAAVWEANPLAPAWGVQDR